VDSQPAICHFLFARGKARNASELATVDATQSSEVLFAILGEILILHSGLRTSIAVIGIILVFAGLALFIRFQESEL
jgi:hypothetical protein